MSLLDFFTDRNKDKLSRDEKEAAVDLKNIIYGYKIGDSNYVPDGIKKLSIILYYLAFKRTHKKVVSMDEMSNPINIIKNPKVTRYLGIVVILNESIKSYCNNPLIINSQLSSKDYEDIILIIQKRIAKLINDI